MNEPSADPSPIPQCVVTYDSEHAFISCCPENIALPDGCNVDSALELLWHTDEAKVIGIKIHLTPEELAAYTIGFEPVSLAKVLQDAYEKLLPAYQACSQNCRERFYQIALRIVGDATFALTPSKQSTAAE